MLLHGGVRVMPYEGYECLRVECERGVAFVTIVHPPIKIGRAHV